MSGKAAGKVTGLQVSPWNLFLLIPLLMLVTPWFNFDKPRLLGLPFFYWFQFLFVIIGVASVAVVYVMTKGAPVVKGKPDRLAAEELDEGEQR
ncbi:DUF3311 domain-containing protein [Amycolatopsis bartoniae]|uniref:DUF3311 domain-containing protein n=1 Tax=Amycolatopsis bartoniae TaxID=941986 RepID=A0A8H9M5J0_9PSEU|nr:DUF3311 domain-containing protein [Amycolatopsis bartoniae]TVT11867.1 DUF3311 domain-containing protein [Amycolatopsis bartoniae]GHF57364.1 hypothetical protein GCM10017566_33200 [Amycolatopsis bartoniae]